MSLAVLLLLPFIGAVLTFIVGKMKKSLAFVLAETIGITLFIMTLILFTTYTEPIVIEQAWFTFGNTTLPFGIYIDHLSLVMLLIATGLGALDIHFAHDYMKDDPDQARYYGEVLFFIGGMILLVTAKELTALFVGWEFMGLASYLLISFWHFNKAPADAGVSAFLYTRFGDIFLFAALALLFYYTGTVDLQKINMMASHGDISSNTSFVIAVFIFIAAIGKSGQFPLFPWLMRAMEGPTTVSALIHGATMVNSGIYIVARMFDFYVAADALIVVAAVASLSAFIGASSALVQAEIKKVLAYSTMSHLSLAFIGLGMGSLAAGMSHLTNHAVFKALLFLGAGAVIMSAHHTKDLWKFGGAYKKLTLVAIFMGIGALSLSGVPPLSGFFSKDAVLVGTLVNPQTQGLIATLSVIAGLLSLAYIGRLWILIFAGKPRDEALYEKMSTPSKFWIALPLGIMALLTIVLGYFQTELAVYISGNEHEEVHVAYFVPLFLAAMALLAYVVYRFYLINTEARDKLVAQPLMKSIHQLLFNGYYVERMITWFAKSVVVGFVAKSVNWMEIHVVDAAVNATVGASNAIVSRLSHTHSHRVSNQVGAMMLGVLLILTAVFIKELL